MCCASSVEMEVRAFVEEFLVGYGFAQEGEVNDQTIVMGLETLAVNGELRFGVWPDLQAGVPHTVSKVVSAVCQEMKRNTTVVTANS
ncbi:MAG: hypothetical protein WC518_01065 [Patescibacteria group bacterium]